MKTALASLLLALPSTAAQDPAPDTLLERRAKDVVALIVGEPTWADDLFNPSFLKAVPPEKMREICRSLHKAHGPVAAHTLLRRDSDVAGSFEFVFENGSVVSVKLGLLQKPPHSIVTLWFGAVAPGVKDFAALSESLGKLRGKVSFAIERLGGKEPVTIAERDADQVLAIGSAFKLYVLGTLARDVAEGQRRPEDTVRLEERLRSLPSGKLHRWPAGSPATLHTLAALMISESDNTATDQLLFALGRERVEAMLARMGHRAAERNVPFLSTGEMFRLKLTGDGSAAEDYLKRDVKARREYLEGEIASVTLDESTVNTDLLLEATHVDTIEWFASARDLCRAMDWLRQATESGKAADLRGLLAINPGPEVSREAFPWVGFKGGSETGVLNLTFLVRSKAGEWYAVSAGWNDARAVDAERLTSLVSRAFALLARETNDTK